MSHSLKNAARAISAAIGASTPAAWPNRMVQAARWQLRRMLPIGGTAASLAEWDHDVPPFPILTGEMARAQASLSVRMRRHYRRLAV